MKKLTAKFGPLILILLMAGCSSIKPNPVIGETPTVKPVSPLELAPEKLTEAHQQTTAKPSVQPTEAEKQLNDPYELKRFTGAFKSYQASDKVPALYRTEQYKLKQWKLRKLPAPSAGSHWTYFGGAYVEITDSDGVIGRIYSGDNIYR